MQNRICVLSDYNYLVFGLTFYESIKQYLSNNLILHYLATDNKSYDKLSNITNLNIKIHSINDLQNYKVFQTIVDNHPRRGGKKNVDSPLSWALAPLFTHHILELYNDPVFYADTDILFYRNPTEIFDTCNNYGVGLVTHKTYPLNSNPKRQPPFNVGVVHFNNKLYGPEILKWWLECVAFKKNLPDGQRPGAWGDQAYLSFFKDLYGKQYIKLIDESVGHGAVWSLPKAKIVNGNYIWDSAGILNKGEISQPMSFFHYSHFNINWENNTWDYDYHGELRLGRDIKNREDVRVLYQNYFQKCKQVKEKYEL